jgi:alpha-D-xyloside xylohydrolase
VGNGRSPDYDYADGVCFHLFELETGKEISSVVPTPQGETGLEVAVTRYREGFRVKAAGARKPWGLCLRGIHAFRNLSPGASAQDSETGLLVSVAAGTETLHIDICG